MARWEFTWSDPDAFPILPKYGQFPKLLNRKTHRRDNSVKKDLPTMKFSEQPSMPANKFSKRLTEELDDSSRGADFLRDLSSVYRDAYSRALAIVGNRADADDVMQEVCIVLWQKYDEFEQDRDFRKWACGICFYVAKAFMRKRRRQSFGLSDRSLAKIEQIRAGGAELFELRRELLHECLDKLGERDQQFLEDCYGSSLSQVEFARSQGMSVETVYTRLKRLRRKLIECINRNLGKGF